MKHFKKLTALIMTLAMIFAMAGCGNAGAGTASGTKDSSQEQTTQKATEANSSEETQPAENAVGSDEGASEDVREAEKETVSSGSNILVVYFSRTGE